MDVLLENAPARTDSTYPLEGSVWLQLRSILVYLFHCVKHV